MQDLQKIFMIIEEHYSKGNTLPEIMNFITTFPTNIDNLEICKSILTMPESSLNCKLFASNSFLEIIKKFMNYFVFQQASAIVEWITTFLFHPNSDLADVIYADLARTASRIFVQFFDSKEDDVNIMIGQFSNFFNNDPSQIVHGLQVHLEIVQAFEELNKKKEKESVFKSFRQKLLLGFFIISKDILLRLQEDQDPIYSLPPKLISQIIRLSCLILSKSIAFKMEDESQVNHNNPEFKKQLSDPGFPIFIFELFNKFSDPVSLDIISSYFLVGTPSFASTQAFYEITNNIFAGLANIVQSQVISNQDQAIDMITIVYHISIILSNLSSRITPQMVTILPNLGLLIESATQFSIETFRNISGEPNIIDNIVTFWTNFEKLMRSQSDSPIRQLIISKSFDIYLAYIELLLNEMIQPGNEETNFNYLSDKISPFISIIQSFVNLNQVPIYQNLMSIYHEKKAQFQQYLTNNTQVSENISKQIAIFIQIFIKFLQSNSFDGKLNPVSDTIFVESFTEIISLMQLTLIPVSQGSHLSPEIEISFSLFIENFKSLKINNQTQLAAQEIFYHRISSVLGMFNPQSCHDFFFRRIINAIQGFYGSQYEKIVIVHLLNTLSQKVFPSDAIMHDFLLTNLDQTLDFLKNFRYRYLFSMSLMSIIGELDNSLLYEIYLSNLNAKFLALPNQEALLMLSADIRGMFSANLKPEYYHIRFNSLFPNKMKLFSDALASPAGQNIQVIRLALQMCKSIVCWVPRKPIKFDHISPNGVILFTFSAQLICAFISYAMENLHSLEFARMLDEDGFKELRYVSEILSYLISGNYVPFEAFMIYNDPVFINVLNGVIQFLSSVNIDVISTHQKTFQGLINFFKELCKKQMRVLCLQLSPEFLQMLMNIIFECISKGMFLLDNISIYSFEVVREILQYIVDEQMTKECENLLASISNESLTKVNICLWQLLFNSESINFISEPIRLFILINRSTFDMIKEKINQIAQDSDASEITIFLKNFEEQFPLIIESDSTTMRRMLNKLKAIVNQKIAIVSFI